MRISLLLALAAPLAPVSRSVAQAPAPKPGPEVAALGAWAGTWTHTYERPALEGRPAQKGTWRGSCAWYPGGFQMVCEGNFTDDGYPKQGRFTMGVHPESKRYMGFMMNDFGMTLAYRGSVSSSTWTWEMEPEPGSSDRFRMIFDYTDPARAQYRSEYSSDAGKTWIVIERGTAVRAK